MIEDVLFSLQMYMRPFKQSELRGEKKMVVIYGWLAGVVWRMGGVYDPPRDRQTDRPTDTDSAIYVYIR